MNPRGFKGRPDRGPRPPRGARQERGPRPAPKATSGLGAGPGARPDDGGVERLHGFRAGLAILAQRPEDVLRVGCLRETEADVEEALPKGAARPPVTVFPPHELERIARSAQHEGLCLEVRSRRWASPNELADLLQERRGVAIALDRVRNSYNIGAILRSAGFFGIDAALLGAPAPHPGLDPNAIRVAEGGVEHVTLARTTDLADTLGRLRARGVKVYGTDGQAEASGLGFRFVRPAILVLGNEREGLGPRVRAACDALVAIRGTGNVESLNVGIAASILIAELAGRRPS